MQKIKPKTVQMGHHQLYIWLLLTSSPESQKQSSKYCYEPGAQGGV